MNNRVYREDREQMRENSDAPNPKGKAVSMQTQSENERATMAHSLDAYMQSQILQQTESNSRLSLANQLMEEGVRYCSGNQFPEALQYLQEAVKIYRELGYAQGESKALGNLGNVYYSGGDYLKAIEYFQQRLAIAQQLQDRRSEGQTLGHLGNAYRHLEDYAKALEYQQQSLIVSREIKDRRTGIQSIG
jgi:tetratricopeptide (TPR) repeat protein